MRASHGVFALLVTGGIGCGASPPLGTVNAPSLTLHNQSDIAICDVVTVGSGVGSTRDHLPAEDRIPPFQVRRFPMPVGVFDLRLFDCDGKPLYGRAAVRLTGHHRLVFRVIEVQRRVRGGSRRFASARARPRS